MKNSVFNFLFPIFRCFLLLMLLAGCGSDDKDEPEPVIEPEADYTVILYGCGGGDLDHALRYNLDQVVASGYSPKVQFTALVKFSADQQENEGMEGTIRYTMEEEGMTHERVNDANFRLDNPYHLAGFIRESMERLPAKKYVLVLWNHGSGFDLWDQPLDLSSFEQKGRGMIMDDNCEEDGYDAAMSIFELEEGLKRSGVKLDMIYWDLCLMNMIENLYQVKDYARYVLGSSHSTPDLGGNYALLMKVLEHHAEIEDAMREYIPKVMDTWKSPFQLGNLDLQLMDMSKIEAVAKCFKPFVEGMIELREVYSEGEEEDALWFDYNQREAMYLFDGEFYSIDMARFAKYMANRTFYGELSAKVVELNEALEEMIVARERFDLPASEQKLEGEVSVGICFLKKEWYLGQFDSMKGYSVIYPLLHFDEVTHWSDYLKINDMKTVIFDGEHFVEVPWEEEN